MIFLSRFKIKVVMTTFIKKNGKYSRVGQKNPYKDFILFTYSNGCSTYMS